jgi:RHH-type rel operon transcriptional repressor/antitoxin RelB
MMSVRREDASTWASSTSTCAEAGVARLKDAPSKPRASTHDLWSLPDWPGVFALCGEMYYIVNIVDNFLEGGVMSKSVTIAARVDIDLDAELERLASATGRSKSWLINEALRSYVATEQQFLAAVEEGKEALRAGKVLDHATVVAAFERIVSPRP